MTETMVSNVDADGRELLVRAESLVPLLKQHARLIEDGRRLTPEVNEAFHKTGLYRATNPCRPGAAEVTLPELMRVLEVLAQGDGSSAWSAWASMAVPVLSAFMDADGADDLLESPGGCLISSFAGMGRAEATEGGYRVSGHWAFLSGIRQATHAGGMCFVYDDGVQRMRPDGSPVIIIPVWPVADCEVIATWDTTGLRGTGSEDMAVRDVFVPGRFVIDFSREPRPGLPAIHYVAIDNAANVTVAAMALGIAAASVEALRALGPSKRTILGEILAESPLGKLALGTAETKLAAARGHLYETVEMMTEEIGDGSSAGEAWLPRTSLASVAAVDASIEVATIVYRAAGSSAIFAKNIFDRCLRDLFTLQAHQQVQPVKVLLHGGTTYAQPQD